MALLRMLMVRLQLFLQGTSAYKGHIGVNVKRSIYTFVIWELLHERDKRCELG